MNMSKAALAGGALLFFGGSLAPALAHEDYDRHTRDHKKHYRFHDDVGEAHARAHDEGFYSRREHRAYHRALRDLHGEFHNDHPNTRHDHYR